MHTSTKEDSGANILAIDGDSVAAGNAAIALMGEVMRRVQKDLRLPEPPLPGKHFRLMVGAGLAGLLAIMFGRLGMSVEETQMHYSTIVRAVFSKKKLFSHSQLYKASKLEAAVKKMLEQRGESADARMMDPRALETNGCRVILCVASAHGERGGVPICLRTYPTDRNSVPDCTIVEAVRSTCATPGLFKPTEITEPGGIKVSYVGLGHNNPTAQLLTEAAHVFQDQHLSCVVSVGAGYTRMSANRASSYLPSLANRGSLDCERIAQEISVRFEDTPGIYFRFSVNLGLKDARSLEQEMSDAVARARWYLRIPDTDKKVSELVQVLEEGKCVVLTRDLRGIVPASLVNNHAVKELPPPSPLFVGRILAIAHIERCLLSDSGGRNVFVLYGLGGAGKTQLALKFSELHRNKYQYVFYVDATSAETIEADLKSLALAKKAGSGPDDALTWLARQLENWLILYNNADDTSLDLRRYFPACSHGNILITTRNRRMIHLAQGVEPEYHVSEMSADDAECLLKRAAGFSESTDDHLSTALVKELGYFALAIVQAGAYIRTHQCSIQEYLDMYQGSRGMLLEDYASLVPKLDDYQLTAHATWRISYERLGHLAKQFFGLSGFMHYEGISEEIFRLAALELPHYDSGLPVTDEELSTKCSVARILDCLSPSDIGWDRTVFLRVTDELRAYSLVGFDPANKSYSIHPLVQKWTRTVVDDPASVCGSTALLLALSVGRESRSEQSAFRHTLLNHLDALPEQERLNPRLAERFARMYCEAGRYKEAELLRKALHKANAQLLGETHPRTLTNLSQLASTYWYQRRLREAEMLNQEVLDARKLVLGDEHPDTLVSMAHLANAYSKQGRWKEAELMQREVLATSTRVMGDEHPNTLAITYNLACTCQDLGQWEEAESLKRRVLDASKRVLGEEHTDTLARMHSLGCTLRQMGQLREAESLLQSASDSSKRVLGDRHPFTLERVKLLTDIRRSLWNGVSSHVNWASCHITKSGSA